MTHVLLLPLLLLLRCRPSRRGAVNNYNSTAKNSPPNNATDAERDISSGYADREMGTTERKKEPLSAADANNPLVLT
jgi:hypothetical protein